MRGCGARIQGNGADRCESTENKNYSTVELQARSGLELPRVGLGVSRTVMYAGHSVVAGLKVHPSTSLAAFSMAPLTTDSSFRRRRFCEKKQIGQRRQRDRHVDKRRREIGVHTYPQLAPENL